MMATAIRIKTSNERRAQTDANTYYNHERFPHFIARHGADSPWDICGDDNGRLASIATCGHSSSHWGDINHLKVTMRDFPQWNWELSDRGRELIGERFMGYLESR